MKDCLVIKYDVTPYIWLCQQCKTQISQPSSLPINVMVATMKAFRKDHKKCQNLWLKSEEKK